MRKFQALENTVITLVDKQSNELSDNQKLTIVKGQVFETEGNINIAKSGKLEINLKCFMFGDHVKEIKLTLLVTKEECKAIFLKEISDFYLENLNQTLIDFNINTVVRIRHFLAQIGHESAGLKYF